VTVIINGTSKKFAEGTTMQQLISALGLEGKVMAAAVNMNIVKQDVWASHVLSDGDKVELLDFVGGG
jgi:sulfur carrier protein